MLGPTDQLFVASSKYGSTLKGWEGLGIVFI